MRSLFSILLVVASATAQDFGDLPEDHWAASAVTELVELGVLIGYPDGTFQGGEGFTRYQAAVMISRLLTVLDTDQGGLAEIQATTETIQTQLDALRTRVAALDTEDVQLALALADEAFNQLDSLAVRLTRLETTTPGTLALFDDIQSNLEQLERGFTGNLLAAQENILTEVDLMLEMLDEAVRDDFATFVDNRLAQYDDEVQERLSIFAGEIEAITGRVEAQQSQLDDVADALRGDVAGLTEDIAALREEIARAEEPDWTLRLEAGGGFYGETPLLQAGLTATAGAARVDVQLGRDLTAHGRYSVTDTLAVTGRYQQTPFGTVAGVGVDALVLAPLGLQAEVGYSDRLEFGIRGFHDGSREDAVIDGLDLAAALRLAADGTSLNDTLIDAQARLALEFGGVTLRPGFLYRWVLHEASYQGFVGELALVAAVSDDLSLDATARYGFFNPLQEGEARAVPEFELGLDTTGLRVAAFLDSGLPPFAAPSFIDSAPLERAGLNFGLRASATLELSGGF